MPAPGGASGWATTAMWAWRLRMSAWKADTSPTTLSPAAMTNWASTRSHSAWRKASGLGVAPRSR